MTIRELYSTLTKEYANLIKLKEQSIIRKIADHEKEKGEIAEIFQRINQAREQLVVRTCLHVVISSIYSIYLGIDGSESPSDRA